MYELIQVGEKTFYINCPAKIGIYLTDDNGVYLIDSGNDKDTGKKVQKILETKGWILKSIINTHSHADHIGGNQFLQERSNCPVISVKIENSFIENPILESSFLYGGYPCKELRNKFLMAKSSISSDIQQVQLPEGLEYIHLDGHSFEMIGIKTSDNIYFLADSLSGENILSKYHVNFLYNVKAHLKTLSKLELLEGKLFIFAHAEITENINYLIDINRNKIYEIIEKLIEICSTPSCFEDILKHIFDCYHLKMDLNQYVLVGSTIRSYLSYLYDEGKLKIQFIENKLLWVS